LKPEFYLFLEQVIFCGLLPVTSYSLHFFSFGFFLWKAGHEPDVAVGGYCALLAVGDFLVFFLKLNASKLGFCHIRIVAIDSKRLAGCESLVDS
jgi:hypothetical protein